MSIFYLIPKQNHYYNPKTFIKKLIKVREARLSKHKDILIFCWSFFFQSILPSWTVTPRLSSTSHLQHISFLNFCTKKKKKDLTAVKMQKKKKLKCSQFTLKNVIKHSHFSLLQTSRNRNRVNFKIALEITSKSFKNMC